MRARLEDASCFRLTLTPTSCSAILEGQNLGGIPPVGSMIGKKALVIKLIAN